MSTLSPVQGIRVTKELKCTSYSADTLVVTRRSVFLIVFLYLVQLFCTAVIYHIQWLSQEPPAL